MFYLGQKFEADLEYLFRDEEGGGGATIRMPENCFWNTNEVI